MALGFNQLIIEVNMSNTSFYRGNHTALDALFECAAYSFACMSCVMLVMSSPLIRCSTSLFCEVYPDHQVSERIQDVAVHCTIGVGLSFRCIQW